MACALLWFACVHPSFPTPAAKDGEGHHAASALDELVTVQGEAGTLYEACHLLQAQLRLGFVAVGEQRPLPSAVDENAAPGRQTLRYIQRPLREALDGIASAFGCEWRDVDGAYVFRPAPPAPPAATAQALAEARERATPPDPEATAQALAELDRIAADGRIQFADLPDGIREVVEQALVSRLYRDLQAAWGRVAGGLALADSARRIDPAAVLHRGWMIARPDPVFGELGVYYTDGEGTRPSVKGVYWGWNRRGAVSRNDPAARQAPEGTQR